MLLSAASVLKVDKLKQLLTQICYTSQIQHHKKPNGRVGWVHQSIWIWWTGSFSSPREYGFNSLWEKCWKAGQSKEIKPANGVINTSRMKNWIELIAGATECKFNLFCKKSHVLFRLTMSCVRDFWLSSLEMWNSCYKSWVETTYRV